MFSFPKKSCVSKKSFENPLSAEVSYVDVGL